MKLFHCVLPGLLINDEEGYDDYPQQDFSNLEKILAKSSCIENRSYNYESALKYHFNGLVTNEIPFGALIASAKKLISHGDSSNYIAASLVYLEADHKAVYMRGNSGFNFTPEYCKSLWAQIKPLLAEDGIELLNDDEPTAILKLKKNHSIATNSLTETLGQDVKNFLPTGEDQNYWRRLFTECQMVLQNHSDHQEYFHSGRPFANSIWFWGSGILPHSVSCPYSAVYSNDLAIHALAKLSNIQFYSIPSNFAKLNITEHLEQDILLLDDSLYKLSKSGKIELWSQAVKYYEDNWFKLIVDGLKDNKFKQFNLETTDGRTLELTKAKLKFFWRKTNTFTSSSIGKVK